MAGHPAKLEQPTNSDHYVARMLDLLASDTERPVIWWHDTSISAYELRDAVLRIAAALRRLGLSAGGTVAILTEVNSPWMLATRYAAHLLGVTAVHVTGTNARITTYGLSTETRVRMLCESGASVLAFDSANGQEAQAVRAQAAAPLRMCELGDPVSGSVHADGLLVTDSLREFIPQSPVRCTVWYTSGSSGRPKGVSKRFASWNGIVLAASAASAPQTYLVARSLSHSVGLLVDIAIASSGSVVLRTEFDPALVLQDIARYRVTHINMGVPDLYALIAHPDLRAADVSSLRRLLYSGSAASPERMKDAAQVFRGVLNYTYGTTETGSVTLLTSADHDVQELLYTVGRPHPGIEVAICDPETGQVLPPAQVGEVVVRSPRNMEGYIVDPELTASVMRDDWVHTGDLGSLGDNGYLRLVGRMNDVAKIQDSRVHPSEVEKILVGHEGVVDAHVYGHRRADLIEELRAAVVLRTDREPRFAELREYISRAMTPTHVPAKFVRWHEFPTNDNGKVDRLLVRQRCSTVESEDEKPLLGR